MGIGWKGFVAGVLFVCCISGRVLVGGGAIASHVCLFVCLFLCVQAYELCD
jgi:hypothetical protein